MSTPSPPTSDLAQDLAQDIKTLTSITTRIAHLREATSQRKPPQPQKNLDIMERSNKDVTKDLVARIEETETKEELTASEREVEKLLNERLIVCDFLAMKLAELRDLEFQVRGEGRREVLKDEVELGAKSGCDDGSERADTAAVKESGRGRIASVDSTSDRSDAEDEDDPEPDESTWPLLYRILGVDPNTPSGNMVSALDKARKTLATKHDPKRLPNDPTAPARWEAITKAHDILSHDEKRMFYNAHGRIPAELEGFDLALLGER